MSSRLIEIFEDKKLIQRIKKRLPHLFQLAEKESSRAVKTKTGKSYSGVKLIWTVDAKKVKEFRATYNPHCDILFVQINWNDTGGLYYIPLEAQKKLFDKTGRKNYIKLPKPGTNPRGVEITKEALMSLVNDKLSKVIEISWQKTKIDYDPYKRWVDYWRED
jgi:hypothetical protein